MEAYSSGEVTDIKIDLAEGCDAVLSLLGRQLDNGNCRSIVRVDIGYFRQSQQGGSAGLRIGPQFRLSDDELLLVFQGVVCCLPFMKTLVIMSYFRADAVSLPVTALEILFRRANRLEILFLHQITLHGSPRQFEMMGKSLKRHPALKRVNLHCCEGHSDPLDPNRYPSVPTLDPLVCALATLPTMYYMSLDQVPISQASIEALAKSPSLKDVSFYNMPQLKSSLPILFEVLGRRGKKGNLRGLRIRSCDLGPEESVSIAKMLETNTSLESLVFFVEDWQDYGIPLASALAQNASLQRLEVGIGREGLSAAARTAASGETRVDALEACTEQHAKAAMAMARALETNHLSSLKHLSLSLAQADGKDLYDAYMGPMERMLESNYTLQHLLLQGKDTMSVVSPKVSFLLRLNQRSDLDRGKLFHDVAQQGNSARPWVESIVRHTNDLNVLFYLLDKNPNLVASMVSVRS